jgi:hypothetical protein
MLILLVHNDGTGTNKKANYDYEVRINERTIRYGKIKDHNRDDGWAILVKTIAEDYLNLNDDKNER